LVQAERTKSNKNKKTKITRKVKRKVANKQTIVSKYTMVMILEALEMSPSEMIVTRRKRKRKRKPMLTVMMTMVIPKRREERVEKK